MKIIFWSPAKEGRSTRNMDILANIWRIRYGLTVHMFHHHERVPSRFLSSKEEVVCIDCKHYLDASVERLFREADTVVVNFPGEQQVISSYFQNQQKIKGNIFYLVNNSPMQMRDGDQICSRDFRFLKEGSGSIPHNPRFEQYYQEKRGFAYQKRLLYQENYDVDREFAVKTCEIAVKLLKMNCLFV